MFINLETNETIARTNDIIYGVWIDEREIKLCGIRGEKRVEWIRHYIDYFSGSAACEEEEFRFFS